MSEFEISELSFGSGTIGMSPLPGAKGDYATEMAAWLQWKPDAVLSMTGQAEMKKLGSVDIPDDLRNANIQWLHFPVDDFQAAPGRWSRDCALSGWMWSHRNGRFAFDGRGR